MEVHTPLVPPSWLAAFVVSGISHGFRVGFDYRHGRLKSASKNLSCTMEHKEVVDEYLTNELCQQRILDPFNKGEVKGIYISRFKVISKNHQKNKWRLIVDLSFPKGKSVNDGISKTLCSLSYITVDDAIEGRNMQEWTGLPLRKN